MLVDQDTPISQGHGRMETRIASVSADAVWLQEAHPWAERLNYIVQGCLGRGPAALGVGCNLQ